jgi:hypothetical protein
MAITIFYSWQSDTPNSTNRGFIEDALSKAIKQLASKIEIQNAIRDEIELDKDTLGVPGTPPIVETIFNKIDGCAIFVPDLTFVGKSPDGRMLPNPNVLIEYGWALKSISHSRIIPVMNSAFGEPTETNLPFDMRHLRNPITYRLAADSKEETKADAKKRLIQSLGDAIEAILKSGVLPDLLPKPHNIEVFTFDSPARFRPVSEPLAVLEGLNGVNTNLTVPDTGSLFLRLVPVNQIDVFKSSKFAYEALSSGQLAEMGRDEVGGVSHTERNKYGAIICRFRDSEVLSLTQLFLSKQIWGIDLDTINREKQMKFAERMSLGKIDFGFFPSVAIEKIFYTALNNYLKFAIKTLALSFPLKFIAGAANVEGYKMTVKDSGLSTFEGKVVNKHIVFERMIEDLNQKPVEILRPLFDHIWHECGLDRPNVGFLS